MTTVYLEHMYNVKYGLAVYIKTLTLDEDESLYIKVHLQLSKVEFSAIFNIHVPS
jgi:hypothetical protein